jgi:hypothetical protein
MREQWYKEKVDIKTKDCVCYLRAGNCKGIRTLPVWNDNSATIL